MTHKCKPKFKEGQVISNGQGHYWKIREIKEARSVNDAFDTYEYRELWTWHRESELRSLTRKEQGKSAKRRPHSSPSTGGGT